MKQKQNDFKNWNRAEEQEPELLNSLQFPKVYITVQLGYFSAIGYTNKESETTSLVWSSKDFIQESPHEITLSSGIKKSTPSFCSFHFVLNSE